MKRRDINRKLLQKIQNYRVIDPETGEDVTYMVKLSPNYTENQVKYAKRRDEQGEFNELLGGFVFMAFHSALKEKVSAPTLVRLMYLATYLKHDDTRIMYGKRGVMTDADMMNLLRCSRAVFYRFKQEALESGVLTFDGEAYHIDLNHFTKGSADHLIRQNLIFTRLFVDIMRELFETHGASNKGLKQLAIIYKLLPYVHLKTNTICKKPQEEDRDKLEPMTLKELAEALDYHEKKIGSVLRGLKLGDDFVLMQTRTGSREMWAINPLVILRGNIDKNDGLYKLFDLAKRLELRRKKRNK
ncbi:hypothetical protein EDC32_102249 [Laceyella sacchari]|uniref:hypothetical protein n=1 Tax=Laceyella sacchari TaxID=37482 RepID=UPI0010540851|nr:hypothetical protein [Laceyella sacchari]TCW39009.1 hypothetical protein EDC32_102249 [Laceyella sacchari]